MRVDLFDFDLPPELIAAFYEEIQRGTQLAYGVRSNRDEPAMVTFARSMRMDAQTTRQAGIGGLMHDLGKMTVPAETLRKSTALTPAP